MPVVKHNTKIEIEYALADGGVVTSREPEQLLEEATRTYEGYGVVSREWSDVRNWEAEKINGEFRGWVSRSGTALVSRSNNPSSLAGTTVYTNNMALVDTGSNYDAVEVCSNSFMYAVDRSSSSFAYSSIAVVGSDAALVPMGLLYGDTIGENAVVVLDGRRPHVYRPNASAARNEFVIAYDKGNFMTTHIANSASGAQPLVGTTVSFGNEIAMSTWCDHGNTTIDGIPVTSFTVTMLASTTNCPGYVYGQVYQGTTLLTTSNPISAASVVSYYANYSFDFTSICYRQPGQTYKEVVTYSSGVGTTYVGVAYTTSLSDGVIYCGGWTTTGNAALIGSKPGLAPTIKYGRMWNDRLFGLHPNGQIGYTWYTNVLDPFEWNAEAIAGDALAQAGPLAIGDASGEIINMIPVQENMYFTKGGDSARVYKLEGSGPSNYSLTEVMTGVGGVAFWSGDNAGNDGFVYDTKGLVSLEVLRETQDTREAIKSHNIAPSLENITAPRLEYVSSKSQLWLYDITDPIIYVYDTELDMWTFFELGGTGSTIYISNIKATADGVYISDTGGNLWYTDENINKDNNKFFDLYFKSSFGDLSRPWSRKIVNRMSLDVQPDIAAIGYVSLFRDSIYTSDWGRRFKVPLSGRVTVGDLYGYDVADLHGFIMSGGRIYGSIIYDHNYSATTIAGINTAQFGYSTFGAAQGGSDYVCKYDGNKLMVKVAMTTWIGRTRLKNMTLRGNLIGRRMN